MVPPSLLYTPLKERPDLPLIGYDPVMCCRSTCQAILNPFCQTDLNAKFWVCCICGQRNQFPQQYKDISQERQPYELHHNMRTIEYTLRVSIPSLTLPLCLFVHLHVCVISGLVVCQVEVLPTCQRVQPIDHTASLRSGTVRSLCTVGVCTWG